MLKPNHSINGIFIELVNILHLYMQICMCHTNLTSAYTSDLRLILLTFSKLL